MVRRMVLGSLAQRSYRHGSSERCSHHARSTRPRCGCRGSACVMAVPDSPEMEHSKNYSGWERSSIEAIGSRRVTCNTATIAGASFISRAGVSLA